MIIAGGEGESPQASREYGVQAGQVVNDVLGEGEESGGTRRGGRRGVLLCTSQENAGGYRVLVMAMTMPLIEIMIGKAVIDHPRQWTWG